MDSDIIKVVVKECVYSEMEKKEMDVNEYIADIEDGFGEYGTYTGTIYHLTDEYGPLVCGTFSVLVKRGEDFPEVCKHDVKICEDIMPKRNKIDPLLFRKLVGNLV